MPDCCAAASCKQSADQSNISFFRFPLEPERCKQWVGNCGRSDLQTKTPEYLHRNFKLCSKHFEVSMIHRESEIKCVLKDGAVPTIFDFTTNKDNAQNSSRKRGRPPAAGDPVDAKKAKDDPQATVARQIPEEASAENSAVLDPPQADLDKEDPAISKAKETLKVYFKETLAFTGFSIGNSAATKSMASGPVGQVSVDLVCAEKIESKEVLKLGEDVMCEEIRNSLRMARFFSILLQDETNIEGKAQIPVFIRSVTSDGFPQKHLLGFLPCDVDSDSLFLMLVSEIRGRWGLRMEHCRGFTYLTTGSLCQKLKELSCRMLRDFPQVVLAPSDPYAFNLWLIRSLPVISIQEVVDTVEEVAALLRQSSTLTKKLHAKITVAYSHIKGEVDRVKDACQNNWEFGTDAFQTMLDILEPLLNSIGEMCTSALSDVDAAIVEQLLKLKEKLKNFNFIITLVVLKNTLCCVSILNPSLRGIISISSTLQYTISNALKLLSKHLQEIPIFHRKWFSDAVGRAKKLGVSVTLPVDTAANGDTEAKPLPSAEDYYRDALSKMILQYLIDEVKKVLGTEMVRILRWLSLVPSYMADHNFSIRKDKVADANLNNLARPDSFYDELGCWEVKWRHASKRRILPTTVFATLKIPDIGFYPNVQSLLRVLGSIPCINADADVYGQYDMVLDRYRSYMKQVPAEKRLCNMAFVYVNQDVHFNIEDMVQSYVDNHPDILQLLHKDDMMDVQPSAAENNANDASKEDLEELREMTLDMELERPKAADCTGTDKEALRSALQAAVTGACCSQTRLYQGGHAGEVEYVTKSEMNEVLQVCEGVVREGILSEVGNSFFSLFVDRAVRFGETDLLPLFLRFVDSFDVMRLELMGFVDVTLDTETMCDCLFDIITKEWRLDLKYCRGQAYLGSGEVAYKLKAFACKVQEKYPLAICTHSSCYSFNTWWSRSVPVPSVSRALDIFEKIVLFFSSTTDLEKQLDQIIAVGLRENYEKVHELQGTFCSSWLEKHDSYDVFAQILEPLADCLERFQCGSPQIWSLAVINQAKKLLQLIRDFDFIVAMVALKNVSSFTKELSASLQKDHFSAASQLCQISGIVATLNRVKTNIKVFHQNWFDEASAFAQSLGVQIKVPDSVTVPRDSLLKPGGYYKDAVSLPLVDHLINSVKDHFSDDHKEALNFLSLVPCSVTVSYTFESLKSKPPLYISDLPDPDNFFTELSCWKVKWKTKVVSPTVPDTIFQTLRLPLMQYFANINTLLKIMCVLPSTALEFCGEVKRHKMFEDYLRNTCAKDRSPCIAMLQVGTNFNRDLDRMVAQCLKVTPKTLEGICLDKESKTFLRSSEVKVEDNHKDEVDHMDTQQIFTQNKSTETLPISVEIKTEGNHAGAVDEMETQQVSEVLTEVVVGQQLDGNAHLDQPADNLQSCDGVFRVAVRLARRRGLFSDLPKEEQDLIVQELSQCPWEEENVKCLSEAEMLESIVKFIRKTIISEVQESPFFSVITDKMVSVDDEKFIPVFVRYVDDCTPKVELLGFLPFDSSSDTNTQAKTLSDILSEEWGLQMGFCRGQSFMCMGAGSQSLRKMALGFLESYPLAVNAPSESSGLAYWLAVSLHNEPITKVLGVVEDLLLFFDQSPRLHIELSQTMEGLLNTPREALAEVPETCWSRWKKTEDFFDILVDMLEGVLSCLDSVSNNANGSWSNSMSIHALILSTAIRESDFVIPLVILKNACAPLRNCSTVFRCGNPADIICELDKIPLIMESLSKMLENIGAVHASWFEEATQLAVKVAGALSYPETVASYESLEVGYRETVSIPVLSGLIEEMKFNFSECHLRALRVLSLLPTCNPLTILPEATEKIYTIYQSDLPEPDMAEEDINTWATAWQEKYQDASPPASISETLLHPEAKGHPNVIALLKLVAVLPSVSMECDLMKTTLNSLRSYLKNDSICRASKTTTVMLLMHHQTLQTLEEVVDRCMENDPRSHAFLSHVKQYVNNMRVDSDLCEIATQEKAVETNGCGTSEEARGMAPALTPDQTNPASQCDLGELSSSALNDTTVTPEDYVMDTNVSSSIERIQECHLVNMVSPPTVTLLGEIHKDTTAMNPSELAAGDQDVSVEPQRTAHDVISEPVTSVQIITMELSEAAAQSVTVEPVTEMTAQSVTVEPVTEMTAQSVTVEPVTEMTAQSVTVEPVTEMTVQSVPLEPVTEMTVQSVPLEPVTEMTAQSVPVEPVTEMTAQSVPVEPVTEMTAQSVPVEPVTEMTAQSVPVEPVTEMTAQSVPVEPVMEMTAQSVTVEPVTEMTAQCVTVEPVTEMTAQCVTVEPVTEMTAQCVTVEPVTEMTAQSVTTEAVAPADDVTMEITTTAHVVNTQPETEQGFAEIATQDVAVPLVTETQRVVTEPTAEAEDVTRGLAVEVQYVTKESETENTGQDVTMEPIAEMETQSVTTEPVGSHKDVMIELTEAVPSVTTDHVTEIPALGATAEHVIEKAVQGFSTESVTAAEEVTMDLTVPVQNVTTDPVTEMEAQGVTTEQEAEMPAQCVTTEPVTEMPAQCVTTEPVTEMPAQGVTTEPVTEIPAQCVATEPVTEMPAQCVTTEPVTEMPAQGVTTEPVTEMPAQGVTTEPVTEMPAQGVTTEPVTEMPAQGVTTEPVTEMPAQGVTTEPVTEMPAQGVTTEPVTEIPAQGVTTEPETQMSTESVAIVPVKSAEDIPMEIATAVESITTETATEMTAQGVSAAEDVATDLTAAPPEVIPEVAAKGAAIEPVTSTQGVSMDTDIVVKDVSPDFSTASHHIITCPAEAAQDVTSECIMTEQDVIAEPVMAPLVVTTETITGDQDETREHVATQDFSMKVTSASQDASVESTEDDLEQVSLAADVAMEPTADDCVTQEHVTSSHYMMEVTSAAQDLSMHPITEDQCVTTEHVATSLGPATGATGDQAMTPKAQDQPHEHVASQDVFMEVSSSDQVVFMEPTNESTEHVTTAAGVDTDRPSAENITHECVTASQVTSATQDVCIKPTKEDTFVTTERVTASPPPSIECVDQVVTLRAQNVAQEHVAAQDVSMEVISADQDQDTLMEPLKEAEGVPTEHACAGDAVEKSTTAHSQSGDLETSAHNQSSDLATSAQGESGEPRNAGQFVTLEHASGIGQDASIKPTEDSQDVTMETRATALYNLTETVTPAHNIPMKSTSAHQAIIMEPRISAKCVTLKPMLEGQGISLKPLTPASDITTKPAEGLSSTAESMAAVEDINMESSMEERAVTEGDVTETERVNMELTEETQGSIVMTRTEFTVPAQDVTVDPVAKCQHMTMASVAPVQDVVMEPVMETQGVSAKPIVVSQYVDTEPVKDVQDVSMDSVTEVQDVPISLVTKCLHVPSSFSKDQDVSAEPMATAQGTDPQVKGVTSQDLAAAAGNTGQIQTCTPDEANSIGQDGLDQPRVDVQDGAERPVTETQAVICQAATVSPSATDHSATAETQKQVNIIVHDVTAQSYATVQDDSSHPKRVVQAVSQSDVLQPVVVAHDNTVSPKGTLSFYDTVSREACRSELANSKLFSIIFEEQVQIEGHPFIPVGICYLDKHDMLCEDTLAFVPLDKDVATFVDTVTAALTEKWGLDLALCRGQSLLSVGATGSKMREVASLLSQRYPSILRTLNSSVCLNVWLGRSSVVAEIAESFMQVEKLFQWLTDSAEKRANLQSVIQSTFLQDEKKHIELSDKLTRNQWESSHDILELTVEVLEAIVHFLIGMKENGDQAEKTQAVNFINICQNFEFILTVVIMKNILSLTKNVSQSLQGTPLEMYRAVNSLPNLFAFLNDMTINIDSHFQAWLQEAVDLASKLQISVDHISQEHYREAVCRGAIEWSISEIAELLSDRVQDMVRCMQVVPYVASKTEGCCKDTDHFKVYQDDLPDWSSLQVELLKWREKWVDAPSELPHHTSVLGALEVPDVRSFPNIEMLLRLLMVLPCYRNKGMMGRGKKTLIEFVQQSQRSFSLLHPL